MKILQSRGLSVRWESIYEYLLPGEHCDATVEKSGRTKVQRYVLRAVDTLAFGIFEVRVPICHSMVPQPRDPKRWQISYYFLCNKFMNTLMSFHKMF